MTDSHAARLPPLLVVIRSGATLLALFTLLTTVYTILVTLAAATMAPRSFTDAVLSPMAAEAWSGPEWFHARPSAAAAGVSGGSNLGPTNPALVKVVQDRVARLRKENADHGGPIPIDLVTASGSGLDPHISPAAARLQVPRVAEAQGVPPDALRNLVERCTEPRTLGVLGQPRVNVSRLNAGVRSLATEGRSTPARDQ